MNVLKVEMSYQEKKKEPKDINVKAFNMISNKNEAKAMREHISRDCKYEFNNTVCNSNQNWNNKTCHGNVKITVRAKRL